MGGGCAPHPAPVVGAPIEPPRAIEPPLRERVHGGFDEQLGRCTDFDPLRRPFFGDIHVHTSYSLDATLRGTRLGPMDAYRFAQGATIGLPPYDDLGEPLRTATLDRRLDFAAVTDHAEFFGVVGACQDPASSAYTRLGCQYFRNHPDDAFLMMNVRTTGRWRRPLPRLCGRDGHACDAAALDLWRAEQQAAEVAYDRSPRCSFTSFVAYEWTSTPVVGARNAAANFHRNVIFRNNRVPLYPITALDQPDVEGLWEQLHAQCLDTDTGCDVLTVPHNPNLSQGDYFTPIDRNGRPIDAAYAGQRLAMEPLIEVYQHKGDSECLPGVGSGDEQCGFEKVPYTNLADASRQRFDTPMRQGFIRYALGQGLVLGDRLGINPFTYGFVAGTDTHVTTAGAVQEDGFQGGGGLGGGSAQGALRALPDQAYFSAGGLAVLYAEENSREALFAAMRRREAYGTSGPRIRVRVFGGWDFKPGWCSAPDLVEKGYDRGVPMGGRLTNPPTRRSRPTFAIAAQRDPGTARHPGAPLQRLQVIKGWLDRETKTPKTRVFDVAGNVHDGDGIDIDTCSLGDGGASRLCTVWTDPSFDPSERAYYYVRVLEVPSCRWTTHFCVNRGFDCAHPTTPVDRACCDPVLGLHTSQCGSREPGSTQCGRFRARNDSCCQPRVSPTIQERAWTSPIWYTPAAD